MGPAAAQSIWCIIPPHIRVLLDRIWRGGSMRLWSRHVLLSALFLPIFLTSQVTAQTTTSGGLTGVITDQSSAVVPNADVEIRDSAKGTTYSTRTNPEGVYRFFFLAPGRFTLTVTHARFREEKRTVNVLLGPPVSVNMTLQIAKATESVS